MKIILGDNQFFGINHVDLQKGTMVKQQFNDQNKIVSFIKDALDIGMDGFMMNSNYQGYEII
ncbi:MAG: hypothetical protein CMP53_00005, partial [Flavobacteriales bacterium]|nr:hypothetical protein [Flavobacteriales bacterium]